MLACAVCLRRENPICFSVLVQNDEHAVVEITLKGICETGDDGAPVITVSLPDED